MYGHCEVCGKKYGTSDGINFSKPCEHMIQIMKDVSDWKPIKEEVIDE